MSAIYHSPLNLLDHAGQSLPIFYRKAHQIQILVVDYACSGLSHLSGNRTDKQFQLDYIQSHSINIKLQERRKFV